MSGGATRGPSELTPKSMARIFNPLPVTLEGTHVRLEPLAIPHAQDLYTAGKDEAIWRYMPRPAFKSLAETQDWIQHALDAGASGMQVPFAIVHRGSGSAIGSTRYLDIRRDDRGLEIGWT